MNSFIFPFEKLDVWQMAVDLVDRVLTLLEELPANRHLRLVSQLEGAVASIPQNIAEGKGRQYKKEFIQFLSIAEGSLYETVTLIEVFRRRKLFSEDDCQELRGRCETIDRKINGLRNSLRGVSVLKPRASNIVEPQISNLRPPT
jgi:four helix bundle protein